MRPSPFHHPIAVLRSFLNLHQQHLAEMAGCARSTIQAVELKRLPLSDRLAMEISTATGVSVGWLLDGDPAAPILDQHGNDYTVRFFETTRAGKKQSLFIVGKDGKAEHDALVAAGLPGKGTESAVFLLDSISSIFRAVQATDRGQKLRLLEYRIAAAIKQVLADLAPDLAPESTTISHVTVETGKHVMAALKVAQERRERILARPAHETTEEDDRHEAQMTENERHYTPKAKPVKKLPAKPTSAQSSSPLPQKAPAPKKPQQPSASRVPGKRKKAD